MNQPIEHAGSRKERVLLVDDEPQVLIALEDVLADTFSVVATDEPERALRLVEEEPDIAVVISDQRMPRMNGDELLTRLRKCSMASRLLATGYADLTAVVRAVNDGQIFAYVTKPWDPDDLLQKVLRAAEHFRLSRELAEERQLLRDLMTNMPDAIFFKDRQQRFVRVNRGFLDMLGVADESQVIGNRLSEVLEQSQIASAIESAEKSVLSGSNTRSSAEHPHPRSDHPSWLSTTNAAIVSPSGAVIGMVGISRDVTERVQFQNALRESEERLRLAFAATNAGLFDWDIRTGKVVLSGSENGLAGVPLAHFSVEALESTVHPDDRARLQEAVTAHLERRVPFKALELRARSGGDQYRWFELNAQATWDAQGRALRLVGSSVDVTTRKEHAAQAARLEFLASYDELTGLPNRALFSDRLGQRIALHRRAPEHKGALVLLDLSRLRQLNETFGRHAGDDLLREMAARLRPLLRPEDSVARLEGSTFAVLLDRVANEADAIGWLESNVSRMSQAFTIDQAELRVPISAGIALFPAHGQHADQLIANAAAALEAAKPSGLLYMLYTPSMNSRVAEKLTLELDLRRAVAHEEFELFYQPKVQLKTGRLVGLEALIRWRHPTRGIVMPGEFISMLEETGMILDVGNWVLRRASRQYSEWVDAGLSPPRIAVNVSAIQLAQPGFVDTLDAAQRDYPLARAGLDIEITESVLVDDLTGNIQKLHAAKQRGFHVAIDDFGTGYSSLGYLSRLPLDSLKVDRAFVASMADDPQQMSIVTTIISLAHALELRVIAEGVETATQAQLLRLLRCDEVQGYLVAKPLPATQVAALLGRTFELGTNSVVPVTP